jgi:hypothetical protein
MAGTENGTHEYGAGLKEAGVGVSHLSGAPVSEIHNRITSLRDTTMGAAAFATRRNGAYGQRSGHAPVARTVGGYPPEMMHRRHNIEVRDPNSLNSTILMRLTSVRNTAMGDAPFATQRNGAYAPGKSVTHAPKHAERCRNTLSGRRIVHIQTHTCPRNDMRDEVIPTSRIKTHHSSHQRWFQKSTMPAHNSDQLTMFNDPTALTPWERNGNELTVAVGVGRRDFEMTNNEAYIKTERQCEEEEDHYYTTIAVYDRHMHTSTHESISL